MALAEYASVLYKVSSLNGVMLGDTRVSMKFGGLRNGVFATVP